ncbi:hypothetical protein C9J03_22490 [Photobacterium gaetbulicola]|uniref:Uncharacterized protein n=1 Tax=Photobacterium gaetbulicola Gung47 TaxID=658445 RepID=A0A0C5WN83_9GAMM|nr:hypothetical protein [Photobacterium gaetbulicola]AJR08593.1 hypothetical protein H744_2c1929 [Photobacterium gaetbulicola Gung47]PSU02963.1 hypothetical protein C9J03_22490 [Photobacterium gaetbulicola]
MNSEIINALKNAKMTTYCLDEDQIISQSEWIERAYTKCKSLAVFFNTKFYILHNDTFNGAAFYKPKFIALNFGVFDLSQKMAHIITNYLVHDITPNIKPNKNPNRKAYYDIFFSLPNMVDANKKTIKENSLANNYYEQIASIFTLFTMFHELGHINHNHGARNINHFCDGFDSSTSSLSSENALDSQTREVICDLYAFECLVKSHVLPMKKELSYNKEEFIKYLTDHLTFISLYFYFLSPNLNNDGYKHASHPPTAFRIFSIYKYFQSDETINISKIEKELIISSSSENLRKILINIFSDSASNNWHTWFTDSELAAWHNEIYNRTPNWYLFEK